VAAARCHIRIMVSAFETMLAELAQGRPR